jgi:3-oxoacyl-[acyl-carrier-protein] synthase-1
MVDLAGPSDRDRQVTLAAMAIQECLDGLGEPVKGELQLILCLAEAERPGRIDGIDGSMMRDIEDALGLRFGAASRVVNRGRVGAFVGLHLARGLLATEKSGGVLLAGVDDLVRWATLQGFEGHGRLLTSQQSNGFLPGEAACALMLRPPPDYARHLVCHGLGFDREESTVISDEPTRGEALANAIRLAASECDWEIGAIGVQISDLSGEQYFFREASLARSRCARLGSDQLDLWHPAESVGEVGAAAGLVGLALAMAAFDKGYLPGRRVLCHASSDLGERAAALLGEGPS